VSLERFNADKVGFEPHEEFFSKWKEVMGANEFWVVVSWMVFDDGSERVDHMINCRPGTTLESAQKVFGSGAIPLAPNASVSLAKRCMPRNFNWTRWIRSLRCIGFAVRAIADAPRLPQIRRRWAIFVEMPESNFLLNPPLGQF
jgi:hypothetical protein